MTLTPEDMELARKFRRAWDQIVDDLSKTLPTEKRHTFSEYAREQALIELRSSPTWNITEPREYLRGLVQDYAKQ